MPVVHIGNKSRSILRSLKLCVEFMLSPHGLFTRSINIKMAKSIQMVDIKYPNDQLMLSCTQTMKDPAMRAPALLKK